MGGGKEKKKTNAMLDEQNRRSQAEHSDYMGVVNKGLTGSQDRAADMYKSMFGGYNRFIEGGDSFDPNKYGSTSYDATGGAGSDSRFGDVESMYRNAMSTGLADRGKFERFAGHLAELAGSGGFDEASRGRILGDVNKMRATADDKDIANRFRGGGVFDEFARTGGYSDADIANIRARATSVIPAYYDVARNEANRRASLQGGYGPGTGALMARMSREQARGAQEAAREAEFGIKENVNRGRQWGAGQMTSAESALQDMRLRALTGASGTETGLWNAIAGNRIGAASAGAQAETGFQGLEQRGKMWGTSGLEGMAESAASRSAAAGAAAAADAKWRAEFDREGRQFGLEGMRSLYGMAPGEVDMYLGANRAGRGLAYDNQGRIIDQRMSNNPQRDWFGTIAGLASGVSGAMTGIGNLGYGRRPGLSPATRGGYE